MARNLIVGIDPGTTVGYAAIDCRGNLVKMGSSKHVSIGSIISELHSLGRVVIVGTDKNKAPSYVEKIAAVTGAKIFSPKYDILVSEKQSIVKNHEFIEKPSNSHELDALASALFAFKNYSGTLTKIERFAEQNNIIDKKDEITKLVVLKEISMHDAMNQIITEKEEISKAVEGRDKSQAREHNHDSIEQEENNSDKNANLRKKIKELEHYNELLKKQRINLDIKLRLLKKEKTNLISVMSSLADYKAKEIVERREKKENQAWNANKKLTENNSKLAAENNKLKQLLKSNNYVAIARMNSFGKFNNTNSMKEIKNHHSENSVIYVDDPSVMSKKTLEMLEASGIKYYISTRKATINALFISAAELRHHLYEDFALINREDLTNSINKKDNIQRIVEKYKERFKQQKASH